MKNTYLCTYNNIVRVIAEPRTGRARLYSTSLSTSFVLIPRDTIIVLHASEPCILPVQS